MLDELEKIARYDYDGFKHLRRCKCWYVHGLNCQEKYVSCIQYIRRTPIKYGDVVVYADMSSGRYLEPYYYGQKNIFIYDGVNLLAAKKYYSGRFKIWELHPTTGIFINRNYWSNISQNPNITTDFIEDNLDKPLDWIKLSFNRFMYNDFVCKRCML